jgi:2-polyprenyl-3-methyl-5-hydroxy-6-metoxy-1,4-benzoquinol methylase
MISIEKCSVCQNSKYSSYLEIKNWRLCECKKCKTIFLNPRPEEKELNNLYNRTYFSEVAYEEGDLDFEKVKENVHLVLTKTEKKFGKRESILEVGAGRGHLLAAARALGYNVTGIEISEESCKYAADRFGLQLFNGTLPNFRSSKQYDLIIFNHSLEHLTDPLLSLKISRDLLTENGLVWITLPNVRSFDRFYNGNNWNGWSLPYHLFHFSPASLKYLLMRSNFSKIYIEKTFFNPIKILQNERKIQRPCSQNESPQQRRILTAFGNEFVKNLLRKPLTLIFSGQNMTACAIK